MFIGRFRVIKRTNVGKANDFSRLYHREFDLSTPTDISLDPETLTT